MSSHHVIRDKQEPALLINHISDTSRELIGQILEWSPTVLVTENVLTLNISINFKIDVAVIQTKNLSKYSDLEIEQYPITIIPFEIGTATETSLYHLVQKTYPGTILVDDVADVDALRELQLQFPEIEINLISHNVKYAFCNNRSFEKWLVKGTIIQLEKGIYYEIQGSFTLNEDNTKLVTIEDGAIKISSESQFIIGEPL